MKIEELRKFFAHNVSDNKDWPPVAKHWQALLDVAEAVKDYFRYEENNDYGMDIALKKLEDIK